MKVMTIRYDWNVFIGGWEMVKPRVSYPFSYLEQAMVYSPYLPIKMEVAPSEEEMRSKLYERNTKEDRRVREAMPSRSIEPV